MPEAEAALRNVEHFKYGYLAIWIILFVYLLFLHLKLSKIEKSKSP